MHVMQNKKHDLQNMLIITVIALYPCLFIFQGIDFTDFGYWASIYKFIFSNPNAIYPGLFLVYLSEVIGGVVHKFFGFLGLISFKIAYVVELYLIYYVVYRLLIPFFEKRTVLISLLVGGIYLNYSEQGTLNWISYNDLTSLFYVLCAYFVFQGLQRDKNIYVLIAGLFLGLNFFVRMSNISGVLLSFAIIIDHVQRGETGLRKLGVRLSYFGLGMLLGIATIIALMTILGHLQPCLESIRLFNIVQSLTPSHELKSNVWLYAYDLYQSLWTASYFILIGTLIFFFAKYVPVKNYVILTVVGLVAALCLVHFDVPFSEKIKGYYHIRWLFWQSGVVVLALLYLLVSNYRKNHDLFDLAFISLIVLLVTPLGSDRSLLNANYGMWLALPLVISAFLHKPEFQIFRIRLDAYATFFFRVVILSIITFYAIQANMHKVFRDSSNRSELTAPVHHRYFWGMYTTRERAQSIDELMRAITLYVQPTDYVLGHEYFSMANYLTDCPPYLYNPNPMFFSLDVYNYLYYKARAEIPRLPVILSAKGMFDKDWPKSVSSGLKHPDPSYDRLYNQQRGIIESLKKEGSYRKVWENNFFEIWRPRFNI